MNKKEFKEITDILFINYSKQVNVDLLEIWYNELKECSKISYDVAIKEIIKKEPFMPSLAKVKTYLNKPAWTDENIDVESATEEEIRELTEKIERIYKK